MKKEIKFLKELQEELKTQPHDSQAAPRFWVVGDYEDMITAEGHHDKTVIYDPNYGKEISLEEAVKDLKKIRDKDEDAVIGEGDILSYDALLETDLDAADEDEIFELYQDYISECSTLNFTERVHKIHPNTMFLTKQEAKDHIKANSYHYSSDAHTYAMTAWRAPKVAKLLEILENFDWDKIKIEEIKKGDLVRLENCGEAPLYKDQIFKVVSDIWNLGESEVVRLESTTTDKIFEAFAVEFLKKVNKGDSDGERS